jgi:energy-coupling factor transporter ATP-binding protein EcfA2
MENRNTSGPAGPRVPEPDKVGPAGVRADESDESGQNEIDDPTGVLDWLKVLHHRLKRNQDALVAVTGPEGSGKSTLALKLAELFDSDFSLRQVHVETTSLMEWAQEAPSPSVGVLDESFDGAFNRSAMANKNKDFVTFLGEARALGHLYFMCIPRFHNLDDYIKNHRVAYRVHVPERGRAVVYESKHSPWDDYTYQKEVCEMKFDKLVGELWEDYQELKLERIQERTRKLSVTEASGFTKADIKRGWKKDVFSERRVLEELVENGVVRDKEAAQELFETWA